MSEITSIVSSRNRDCTGCRIISGSGLIGAGLYIAYHSQKLQKTVGKTVMFGIAASKISNQILYAQSLKTLFVLCHHNSNYYILFFHFFLASIGLGLSRIFDLPPFRHQFESE